MKLLLALLLVTTPIYASDVFVKGATNLNSSELGVELHMMSDNPDLYSGVFGIDLDTRNILPTFNFGINYFTKDADILIFTGFGLKKENSKNNISESSNITTTTGKGNGKCNEQKKSNGKCQDNKGLNKHKNETTKSLNTLSQLRVKETNVYNEIGIRVVPRVKGNIKPLIELSSEVDTGGLTTSKFQMGILIGF